MQPEQSLFPDAHAALCALERAVQINQEAWNAKARLNNALNSVDRVIQATEHDKQVAQAAILLFAEIPGALGAGDMDELRYGSAEVRSVLSTIEQDVIEIIEKAGL